jgi:hypothetical protein
MFQEHPGRTQFAVGGAASYVGTTSSHKRGRTFLATNFVATSHKTVATKLEWPKILWLVATNSISITGFSMELEKNKPQILWPQILWLLKIVPMIMPQVQERPGPSLMGPDVPVHYYYSK